MTPEFQTSDERDFNPMAAVLAWAWPGLGHISLGHPKRGFLIMFGVLFLYLGGLLIGGIDCVDRKSDRLWFVAQSVCGPLAFATDQVNQVYLKRLPTDQQLQTIGLNKPNEMGTLFCALAGLMNLVVIIDALCFAPKPKESSAPPVERRRAVA
jgi:hypothetical protein